MTMRLENEMKVCRITLADGRYLIFYSFERETRDPDKGQGREIENVDSPESERGSRV